MFIINLTKSLITTKSLCNHTIRPLAHYVINQNGEKVVVSKRTNIRSKREKWQNVKAMEYEDELKKIRKIEFNDRLHADPEQARQMAEDKFQQLADRLKSSGYDFFLFFEKIRNQIKMVYIIVSYHHHHFGAHEYTVWPLGIKHDFLEKYKM